MTDSGHEADASARDGAIARIRATETYGRYCAELADEAGYTAKALWFRGEESVIALARAQCAGADRADSWLRASASLAAPERHFDDNVAPHISDAVAAMCAFSGLSSRAAAEGVLAAIRQDVCRLLAARTASALRQRVPSGHLVSLAHQIAAPGSRISHFVGAEAADASTVVPDEAFAALLRFVNLSPDEYLDAVVARGAPDPRAAGFADSFPGPRRHAAAAASRCWKSLGADRDVDKPALLSADELADVVDAVKGGGAPVFVCRAPLRDFVRLDPDSPVRVLDGGLVGIHDFATGAGSLEPPRTPPVLMDGRRWLALDAAVHAIHGFDSAIVEARFEAAPRFCLWTRTDADTWVRRTPSGGAVVRRLSDARIEEFEAARIGWDGRTSNEESWPDFGGAIAHGESLCGGSSYGRDAILKSVTESLKEPWTLDSNGESEYVVSRPAVGGGAVRIWRRVSQSDGVEEFWVTTHDADGGEGGPYQTAGVWPSLAEACSVGDGAAESGWVRPPAARA